MSRGFSRLALLFSVTFMVLSASPAHAQPTLSAEIVSWEIIGLDSNEPATSAPEIFMVQVKVTNTGSETATGVAATLTLTSPDCGGVACVTVASNPTYTIGSLAPGETRDAFWTVKIAKTSAAFGTSTLVDVSVTADNAPTVSATQAGRDPAPCGNASTPGNTLFVEDLISQNRNNVISYTVSPGVQLADGSWEVIEGSDFTVTVAAHTATVFSEISVPATIDPSGVLSPTSVLITFTQGTASDDDIYTLDAGGEVLAEYRYRASNLGTIQLAQLIYDCSGNSFHYNTDYLSNSITIHVVAAPSEPSITLSKSASPNPASPGEQITITITYTNSGLAAATNFVITDTVDPLLEGVTPGAGGVFDPATRTITWNVGTVPGLSSGSVFFTATVSDFSGGRTLTNVAAGTADQFGPISSPRLNVPVRPTTPVTGLASWVLAVLGWASIGFGTALSARRFESLRL